MQQTKSLFKGLVFLTLIFLSILSSNAQNIWEDVSGSTIMPTNERYIIPVAYKTYSIDLQELGELLDSAPKEFSVEISSSNLVIDLPMPNGDMRQFAIVESSLMPTKLSEKFPSIKSFVGQGLTDRTATLRMSVDHNGFHAMMISASGTVYIDPYSLNDTEYCISYFKEDFYATNSKVRDSQCMVGSAAKSVVVASGQSGDVLRTYRAAIACSGEYTEFHGGTVADAIAAINTTLNRINEVYEREASFRLVLVENNDELIYTNSATDPYSNGNAGAMIDENQDNIDDLIGSDNYDIGHVFGKDSGGLAGLGVVCSDGQKGRGITGHFAPVGDPFDIDYVCHEMGHQFGGNHTQNNSCERTSTSAFEPGSASTIMGYAGICPPNIQNNSDDYYHTYSFDQITAHTNGDGWANDCAEQIETGNNIPVANAGDGGFTIPVSTPFELIGSGNDVDAGDALTYCWEEFDLGPVTDGADNDLTAPTGNQPIFRTWSPTTSSTRVFPRLNDLLNGTSTIGELLPTYSRDLTFRLTVRDNNAGGGGVSYDQMDFDVSDIGGPFLVNNVAESWEYGNTYTVTWDVANTDAAPISCSEVDIYLSLDGGNTFDQLIAEGVSNNGSADVICPNEVSAQARVKVKAANNVFFNISNIFEITEPSAPNFTINVLPESLDICSGEMAIFDIQIDPILSYDTPVTLSVVDVPEGVLVNFDPQDVVPGDNSTLTISSPFPIPAGNYPFQITATSDDLLHQVDVEVNVYEGLPVAPELNFPPPESIEVSLTPTFTWEDIESAAGYTLHIATDSDFIDIIHTIENIDEPAYPFDILLGAETEYFWAVVAQSPCGDSENSDTLSFVTGEESVTEIPGCSDPTMFNYNPLATIDDDSCEPYIFGCLNPEADNFDPEANSDNGSCIISGCTNELAENYNPEANNEDGSCIIAGCTDPEAFNFNEDANLEDGSCIGMLAGCTDPEAYNFNPNANEEDGSCDYTSLVIIQYEQLAGSNFHFWAIINEIPVVSYLLWNMGDGTTYTGVDEPLHYYQENGTYEVSVNVVATTGAFIAYTTVVVTDVSAGCMDELAINFEPLATIDNGSCIDPIYGCTDENAINYYEEANSDDGSCIGVVYGCTDVTALNYDANANIDDGSCEQEILGCTDLEALNYDENANSDDGSCEYPLPTEPSWTFETTSNNHIILIPSTGDITINDAPIEMGDYLGVFYLGLDGEYYCAGMMMWTGITNTMTVYGADANEYNGMEVGEEFTWMTWKASLNEVRLALADYDLSMPNTDTYAVDGISALSSLSNTMSQSIELTEGWNLISTYIVPDYPSIGDVFETVVDDLFLAKDELGNVYWPEWSLNNIGDHIVGKAYKVKMNADGTLEVRGAVANPLNYPLVLNEGWSYLGYLRKQAADASVVLQTIEEDVMLIKDGIGNVYWPEFNVNTIGNMEPGKGYQIRMTNERVFTYPTNDLVLPELRLSQKNVNKHYTIPSITEMSMNVALPNYLLENTIHVGDEFAVKNSMGEVISAGLYEGETVVMTIWIDESDLDLDLNLHYWSSSLEKELLVSVAWDIENSNLENNAVTIATAIDFEFKNSELFDIYPNPTSSVVVVDFYQEKEGRIELSLYNTLGRKVKQITRESESVGEKSISLDVQDLVNGVYLLKLNSRVELLEVNR